MGFWEDGLMAFLGHFKDLLRVWTTLVRQRSGGWTARAYSRCTVWRKALLCDTWRYVVFARCLQSAHGFRKVCTSSMQPRNDVSLTMARLLCVRLLLGMLALVLLHYVAVALNQVFHLTSHLRCRRETCVPITVRIRQYT